jgi:hypothetical protein
MHLLIAFVLAAGPVEWVPSEQLKELQCVRQWAELCAMRKTPFPILRVTLDSVVVEIDMERELRFAVKTSGKTRTLTATHEGTSVKATLTTEGNQLVWTGVDPRALVDGEGVKTITARFVKSSEVEKIIKPLVKKFVPGGACEGLAVADPDPALPCLNAAARER